jgi:hypothetical protein
MTRPDTIVSPALPLAQSLLEVYDPFPSVVYVVRHANSGKYGCFVHAGTHGLACFESQMNACMFAGDFDLTGMCTVSLTFDEAREIAKDRPAPVTCLMLLDNPDSPKLHYVR